MRKKSANNFFLKKNLKTLPSKYSLAFFDRAQIIFYSRVLIYLIFLFNLFFWKNFSSSHTQIFVGIFFFVNLFLIFFCRYFPNNFLFSRTIHLITLNLDLILLLFLTQKDGILLSPYMSIHPFFSGLFLLLFRKPILLFFPFLFLLVQTFLTVYLPPQESFVELFSPILMYTLLNGIVIFFTHLSIKKERNLSSLKINYLRHQRKQNLKNERERFAREFHDTAGSSLASIALQCEFILGELKDCPDISKALSEIRSCASFCVDDMRRSIALLVDQFEICEQIKNTLNNFSTRHGLEVFANSLEPLKKLALEQQVAICKILQESLINVVKHAQTKRVYLECKKSNQNISLTIKDNGVGFDPSHTKENHYGLKNMKERARLAGFSLDIFSSKKLGTQVRMQTVVKNKYLT